jgi:hypothetical protein
MAKVFQDQIPPSGGRKYQISANSDGSSNITDITKYQQDGTPLTAEFLNGLQDGTYPVGKADKLATAHKIGSADFDGSADITLEQIGITYEQTTVIFSSVPANGTAKANASITVPNGYQCLGITFLGSAPIDNVGFAVNQLSNSTFVVFAISNWSAVLNNVSVTMRCLLVKT